MTPKEKAKELVNNFKTYSYYDSHDLTSRRRREESNIESAIECALIAVDEILKASPSKPIESDNGSYASDIIESIEYWQEVKTEIENL